MDGRSLLRRSDIAIRQKPRELLVFGARQRGVFHAAPRSIDSFRLFIRVEDDDGAVC
jgi:hypothetical protein